MDDVEVARLRATRQGVAQPRARTPLEAVAPLLAVQGQDALGTPWSIALRTRRCKEEDVTRALRGGNLVRTWAFRGTLFVLPARDLRWVLDLVAPRVLAAARGRHRQLGLDEATLGRADDVIGRALARGKRRTRAQLLEILRDEGVSTAGQRAPHLLQHAALTGVACQAETVRGEPVYRAAGALLRRGRAREREDALAELASRYVESRGPARAEDLAWFAGLPLADARLGLKGATGLVEDDGLWSPEAGDAVSSGIRLVPGFDEMMLGYRDRAATMPPKHVRAWWPGGGSFRYVVLHDGRAVGTWARTVRGDVVEIAFTPFSRWPGGARAELREEAERYARFLGKELRVR